MLHNILIYMKEIHIHNILSNVLYILVWFFSTTVTCSCSLPPSSFHDPFSVFFCPDLCLSGWPLEQHCSDPLAIWLPVGFSQWEETTGASRMGKDEDWVFIPWAQSHASFLPWHWSDSNCGPLSPWIPTEHFSSTTPVSMMLREHPSCFLSLRLQGGSDPSTVALPFTLP